MYNVYYNVDFQRYTVSQNYRLPKFSPRINKETISWYDLMKTDINLLFLWINYFVNPYPTLRVLYSVSQCKKKIEKKKWNRLDIVYIVYKKPTYHEKLRSNLNEILVCIYSEIQLWTRYLLLMAKLSFNFLYFVIAPLRKKF